MANKDHQLHNCSLGETLNCLYPNDLSVHCHPLPKSSTNLEGTRQGGFEESQSHRRDLPKSLSGSVCQAQEKGTATGRTLSSFSPQDNAQRHIRNSSRFFRVDQSPTSEEGMVCPRTYLQGRPVEKLTPASGANLQHQWTREGPGVAVRRSHSDLTCSCKQPSPAFHMESSATSPAAVCSDSSNFALLDRRMIAGLRYGADPRESSPDLQSHRMQFPSLSRDHNIVPAANVFHQGATSHNVAIFTDSGAYQANVLASSPASFSTRTMHAPSRTGHSGFSTGTCPPGMVAIPNGVPPPYSRSHAPSAKEEGTVPAYCHSLPIPSLQFTPRPVCPVNDLGEEQANPEGCSSLLATEVSSVNWSSPEAPHILGCCGAHGERVLQPYGRAGKGQEETKTVYVVWNSHQDGVQTVMKTKDTWTMTSRNDLHQGSQSLLDYRDAEVQTFAGKECKSVATSPSVLAEGQPHVFPEVNLKPEAEGEKTPVRDIRWDDEGMTWEVYGAAVDPEVLGMAIQKHLEIQIEQFQSEPEELCTEAAEKQPAKEEKRLSFGMVMHCLRNPACCARSNMAVE